MKILVTGGAGFIGSNLVEALLKDSRVQKVIVLDNLSTGYKKNIITFINHPKFEFIEGDIRDYQLCLKLCEDTDLISHQAALGSVPRSIVNPLLTNEINITGTLNVFTAAKEQGVKRIVFAASSSTYGDNIVLPKIESNIGKPLSPYAVTKYVNELYADVYARLFGLEYMGLRYFNVFGPKQNPKGAYAAVIPLFIKAALGGKAPIINGDGSYSRDFTYVANAVEANILALFAPSEVNESINPAINQIYNIAFGQRITLNELWQYIKVSAGINIKVTHGPNRQGDIPHSLADISKAKRLIQYYPKIDVKEGLKRALQWYQAPYSNKE